MNPEVADDDDNESNSCCCHSPSQCSSCLCVNVVNVVVNVVVNPPLKFRMSAVEMVGG